MPLQRAASAGEHIRDLALDLVFQDGEIRHLMTYATPLRDQVGAIHGAVCCFVDVTEIRRAEEALAKAQKMESLGMLAGGLAHDFNNIFQSMVANLEMAEAVVEEDSRGQLYLQRLKVGLDRASRLSRDILHCSGGDLRRPESLELAPLISETLDRTGLSVIQDFSSGLPRVMVDPILIGRVVEGLVTNALEANSPHGVIRARTYVRTVTAADLGTGHWPDAVAPGIYAVLEISDQGHGIDAATLPRIFDPFFSTRDIGRGLGLAAALGILRGHRGGFQVESLPGVGSVFRVHLPAPDALVAPSAALAEGPHSRNLVLLVDDEEELRSVLAEMLEAWFGLEVVTASDGLEAMEAFGQRPAAFDLVILDATMPRMGGVEAFQAMRSIRPELPGILCSGYALPVSRNQALAQGFADFLRKPFTSAELEVLLDRVMGVRLK
jgi:signal transduction histidine kinase/ActR/RegA family two-component response regulator